MKWLNYLIPMAYQQYRQALHRLSRSFNKYELWQKTGKTLGLSKDALIRLEWFIFYQTTAKRNASLTIRHFGLIRSVFYYWLDRFDEQNLRSLENRSTAPLHARQRQISSMEEQRIIALRKEHLHWGKMKLEKEYSNTYGEKISSWQFQRTIQLYGLYPKPAKNTHIQSKRRASEKKKKITELKVKLPRLGYLLHFDTIELHWNGLKRYVITMIDHFTKLAFARMYATKSSASASDFLSRIDYLLDGRITNAHQDNGSEFNKHFKALCQKLNITQYHSRPHTPKDNPICERFNQTLEYEWLKDGNLTTNIDLFNQRLKEFIIEYNFKRPHQALGYLTPIQFAVQYRQLSERYPLEIQVSSAPLWRYSLITSLGVL